MNNITDSWRGMLEIVKNKEGLSRREKEELITTFRELRRYRRLGERMKREKDGVIYEFFEKEDKVYFTQRKKHQNEVIGIVKL